jgi:predicted acyltransferase
MSQSSASPPRLLSLDQFRGYTVLGMFLVNFVGSFPAVRQATPLLGHHHTYCSYADTIMPHFLFAVGFAFRLTFLRRASESPASAYWHAVQRNILLILVAFVVYSVGSRWEQWENIDQLKVVLLRWSTQDLFQTLTHIAVTSLWVLPLIGTRPSVRIALAIGSGVLHVVLSYWFNYRWVNTPPNGVDGGPLGILTWAIPLLVGSLVYDAWNAAGSNYWLVFRLVFWGVFVMAFAYGLSCVHLAPSDLDDWNFRITTSWTSPPLVHVSDRPPTNDLFTMSQRSGSVTYTTFGAGLSLVVFAIFVLVSDIANLQLGVLRTLGGNALAGYILHGLVSQSVKPFVPRDAPLWYVYIGLCVYLLVCYVCLRYLEKQKLILKL